MFRRDRGEDPRRRTSFAGFLRREVHVEPVRMLEVPHRATVEARLGAPVLHRAVYDPAGCEARGVAGFVEGMTLHLASLTPALEVVWGLLTSTG